MYAVGKVGSLISRSVYTVSGPFHPFGGAVDIVVVQQQDGSFKSSPWYVRFGKFQGVLKTREKVVNISVNGVEAGFHMYLDSNGEAYFLRDADPDGEEGEFIVSPASSGDEQEVPTLRKSKSTSCDSSTMEADVEDNKILARTTTSRRITILERMFGRKSVKHDAHSVDRVSSLERAEIAAELLDTKWSTNLSRGSTSHNSDDQPSKSIVAGPGISDQMEASEILLPEHSCHNGKEMESNCNISDCNSSSPGGGRNSSANETDNCLQPTSLKEEVTEIYTHESSDFTITSTADQAGSEYLSNDPGTDRSIHEPVETLGGSLHNFENVTGREIHTKEFLSDGVFEIHSIDTEITDGKSEMVSHFVTGDSDGANQNSVDTHLPTYHTTDVSTERHAVLPISSAQDVVEDKMIIISSTVESYAMSTIFVDKVHDAADISLTDGVDIEKHPIASHGTVEPVISEEYRDLSNKEDTINTVVQDHADSVLEDLQVNGPNVESFVGAVLDNCSTDSLIDGVDIEKHSIASHRTVEPLISEEYRVRDLSNKEDTINAVVQDHADSVLEDLQVNGPDMESSVGTVLDNCSTDSLTDGGDIEKHSIAFHGTVEPLISEEYIDLSNKEDTINAVVQDHADSVLEDLQVNGPDMESSVGTVVDNCSTDSSPDIACQHDRICPDASSNSEGILMPENVLENMTKNSSLEKEACSGELNVSVTQASRTVEGSGECIVEFANFSSDVKVEDFPISTNEIEAQNTKIDDVHRPIFTSGDTIRCTQDETEETEAAVSFAEHIEEIQFQFSDTESFADTKVVDEMTANKKAGEKCDESDCDAEEQHEGCNDSTNDLESFSVPLIPESSPLPIPGCELHSEDNSIGAKSLPNLRSHIHDLERSASVQLSRSLCSNPENIAVEPDKNMKSAEQEPEANGDPEEKSKAAELTSKSTENEHSSDQKVDSFNPVAELSLCRHLLSEGMGEDAACRAFDSEKVSLEKFRTMKQSLTRNKKLVVRIAGRYFPWDAAAPIVLGMISFSEEQAFESQGMIKVERVETSLAPGGSWRWPFSFRRTRAISTVEPVCESIVETPLLSPVKEADIEKSISRTKRMDRKVRALTPTSEELASLNLREGRNVVTFTFSTAMLGKQQVDCRIYLWKWNTRIVISDVDGTITKSDVLGQFMPLVGVDWSQNGVAHLFSAIKENGYQLLFLSARSISQAHLTRQFLFNLKQDGKALPDGPVVISPDGLFPSLYREVIRRAPHEFKISCLEAIRALFPPDSNPNPFYAGFGNRDTDELSYLKVGIPVGKIFIINPKGEVAVNHRVDTKSYTSLHALVNGMFPPISLSPEQEDYNSWNYWKMPLPDVDI